MQHSIHFPPLNLECFWDAHWPERYELKLWIDDGAVVYDEGTGEITALSVAHGSILQGLVGRSGQSLAEIARTLLEQEPSESDLIQVDAALRYLHSVNLVRVL